MRRVDIQPLIDKVGSLLATWKGKLLNRAGRLKLINLMLTSIPTYYLTISKLQKWAIKTIDKLRRIFLWKGAPDASGGHYLVKWGKEMGPKSFGGLGILDLDLFSRALRLRWLWFEWVSPDKPWVGTELPINTVDRQLFRESTVVTLGNGATTSFWQFFWLNGQTPMDLYPDLFKLAWQKNKRVKEEFLNQNWTRGLWEWKLSVKWPTLLSSGMLCSKGSLMMNKIQLSGDGQLMEVKLPCQLIIYNSWVLTAISKETPSGKWKLKAFFFLHGS